MKDQIGARLTPAALLLTTCLCTPALAETVVLDPLKVTDGAASAGAVVDGYQARRTSTATKTDTPLIDVPQSVSVVTKEAMEDQNVRSMSDAVRYVPGVTAAQGEGNRDQMVIRGNNSTADFFANGIRDDIETFRDVYNVDRMEVLKGPNAMIFGRGGGGGVINRVMKQADGSPVRSVSVQAGMYDTRRVTADVGDAVNSKVALRVNGVIEDSESYRDYVSLKRQGINPTMTLKAGDKTTVTLGYEYFHDDRTADRGIPSKNGKPFQTDPSTFFGNPDLSVSEASQHAVDAVVDHEIKSGTTIKNRTRFATYDKFYQNVFANSDAGSTVTLAAYSNATDRQNVINQTDLTNTFATGSVKHTLLTGVELGRQATDNARFTGASRTVSINSPTNFDHVNFVANNNNSTVVTTASAYVQDQVELTEQWQVIGGLRYDRFDIDYTNNMTKAELARVDNTLSPRLGVVFKPIQPVSVYTSYSKSFLPSSGNQFGSLTASQANLAPESFTNLELGAKWDVRPDLSLTSAVFQLDRDGAISTISGTTTSVRTGLQRTRGFELGVNGKVTPDWQMTGGYAYQDAAIAEATAQYAAGKAVGLVPAHTVTLWNKYQFTPMWAAGLGVIYQDKMAANTDNAVTLPAFTRFDAAIYANLNENLRAQLNVQNLFDVEYYPTAHSNNNITPGAPRTVMLTLTSDF